MSLRSSLLSALLVLGVAGGCFWWRHGFGFAWDDTPQLSYHAFDLPAAGRDDPGSGTIPVLLREAFSTVTASGYRPLSEFLHRYGERHFSFTRGVPGWWLAGTALLYGLLALGVWQVGCRTLGRPGTASLATYFFLASPPVFLGMSAVFAGIQVLVPLVICGGLVCYERWRERGPGRWAWGAGLAVLMLLGPWFREFTGILPLLVLVREAQRRRGPTRLMGAATLFLLHALFPTTLPRLLGFPGLPWRSVFGLGSLGERSGDLFKGFVPAHFFTLFPPLLWVVGIGGGWIVWRRRTGLSGVDVAFLLAWFLLAFLPFFRIYTSQVHLAYALLPGSMLLAALIRTAWDATDRTRPGWGLARCLLAAILALAAADQGMHWWSARRVSRGLWEGERRVADWLQREVPERAVLVTNVLSAEDLRLWSGNRFLPYWTVTSGVCDRARVVATSEDLRRLLERCRGKIPVFFLAVEFRYPSRRESKCAPWAVRRPLVPLEKVGTGPEISVRYPMPDPLQALLPREIIPFLGPPDLENDFYRGPARGGPWYLREVYAEYHLYRTRESEDALLPTGPWPAPI